jgi:hypothetical protein
MKLCHATALALVGWYLLMPSIIEATPNLSATSREVSWVSQLDAVHIDINGNIFDWTWTDWLGLSILLLVLTVVFLAFVAVRQNKNPLTIIKAIRGTISTVVKK